MPNFNFSQPPSLQGPEAAQLVQMHRFLFRLTEQLNAALSETDRRIENTDTTARYAAKTAESNAGTNQSVNDLRSLIIKTVDTVESEMDKLEYELKSNYIGKSEWGEYQEQIKSIASATAESTVDSYEFSSRLDSLDAAASGFEQYMTAANGYIKRGIIGYDEDNIPIFGVAISQDLKSKTVVIDGETYEEIDTTKNLATFTAGKLSFWIDGVEMAYFSNSELVITRINVEDSITFDDVWKLSRKYGLTLEYLETLVADALEGGKGVAFGKQAATENLLDSAWDIHSDGDIDADGSVTAGGDISGADINASGAVSAQGNVSGVNGTFTGNVSAANVTASGNLNGKNSTLSGTLNVTGAATFKSTGSFAGATALAGGISNFGSSVQGGHVDITSLSDGDTKDVTVKFPKAFKAKPFVIVCPYSGSTASGYGNLLIAVVDGSITTSQFKIRGFNVSGSTKNPGVAWLAIGTM